MYKIEKKDFGIQITFAGFIEKEEMLRYKADMRALLDTLPAKFGIIMDMREMKPLPADSQEVLNEDPELVASRLTRSITLVNSALVSMQSKRLAKESHVSQTKRHLDPAKTPNWEKVARDWIVDGVEPSS